MRTDRIVMPAPLFDHDLSLAQRIEDLPMSSSSRSLPLNDSMYPFSQGLPFSM